MMRHHPAAVQWLMHREMKPYWMTSLWNPWNVSDGETYYSHFIVISVERTKDILCFQSKSTARETTTNEYARFTIYKIMAIAAQFTLIGVVLGVVVLILVVNLTSLFNVSCPTVQTAQGSRICNNRGVCSAFALCLCDPLFSGPACNIHLVPGYDLESNTECHNNGVASPFMTEPIAECKEEQPTLFNRYFRDGPGWGDPECKLKVDLVHQRLARGEVVDTAGIPVCACHSVYGGPSCKNSRCPLSSDFSICGGNGNSSVGFVRNDTRVGLGCQCQRHTTLLDFIATLTADQLEIVQRRYLPSFKRGFCGTPYVQGETILFVQGSDDVRCYCDESHYGEACIYGVCPDVNGITCGGEGHPDLGFGYARNTDVFRPGCLPVCAPPAQLCNGQCAQSCVSQTCPMDSPIRCATGECVSLTHRCGEGYVAGSWDNASSVPRAVNCTRARLLAETVILKRQLALEQCLGEDAVFTTNGFTPGPLSWTLDAIGVEFTSIGLGTINVSFAGQNFTHEAPGYARFMGLPSFEDGMRDAYVSTSYSVTVEYTEGGRVLVAPDPSLLYPGDSTFRLVRTSDLVPLVIYPVSSSAQLDSIHGAMIMAVNEATQVLAIDGSTITSSVCLESPLTCLWFRDTLESIDGSKNLCLENSTYYSSDIPCNLTSVPNTVRVRAQLSALVNDTTLDVDDIETWTLQRFTSPSQQVHITVSGTAEIQEIAWTLRSDLVKQCACPPFNTNRTDQSLTWLSQTARARVGNVGQYGVAVRMVHGIAIPVRGIVTLLDPPRLVDSLTQTEVTVLELPARITPREFSSGVQDCLHSVHPARCADGSCASFIMQQVDGVAESCDCVLTNGLHCSCVDSFQQPRVCIDDTCGVGWRDLLNETCFWSPQLTQGIMPSGFSLVDTGQYVSNDRTPVQFILSSCDAEFTYPLPVLTECISGNLVVNVVTNLVDVREEWTLQITNVTLVESNSYTHWGGISTGGNISMHVIEPIPLFMDKPVTFTSVFVHLVTVGLDAGTRVLPVEFFIQASETLDENWVTLTKVSSRVVNGSEIHTIPIPETGTQWRVIRLWSYFPLLVRAFIPFVDQNCTHGRLTGSRPSFISILANPPNVDLDCVCDDTCVIDGIPMGQDGVCTDTVRYPNATVCAAGTDCSDCGCNNRNSSVDPSYVCASQGIRDLVLRHANTSSITLEHTWTLAEYLTTGQALLNFSYVTDTHTAWRWIKPECVLECPLFTCKDGSCAHVESQCPSILYSCPGDGCVRADINLNEYKCACRPGQSGDDCIVHRCTPGDPQTGLIDPHKWCTCNGPSPLRILPPYELVHRAGFSSLSDQDILDLNRPGPREVSELGTDVGWIRVRAEKAPWGIPFLRLYTPRRPTGGKVIHGNATFHTNCPYRVKSALGVFLELEECVESREPTDSRFVTAWKTHPDGQVITWATETQYDDAPYRCPAGHCVAHERDCSAMLKRDPLCGGGGVCLADGTCDCVFGRESFIVTADLTKALTSPYGTNPARWGQENNNRYVSEWCKARNCSEVDCSPPVGCFPGTPSLDYRDRHVECPATFKCAVDLSSCVAGEVTEPMECSGNGVSRQRDYRPDEWYCECGHVVHGVFRPNGWGGRQCQDYACQDDPHRIYYSRHEPLTLERYKDRNGYPLPGKYIGPCEGPIGANPDDIVEWTQCCPGIKQLEACTQVPCVVGGLTQCLPMDVCQGSDRTPKVYVCNGKGRVLADGSCLCDKDETSGTGYTHDYDVYSEKGCYATVSCPVSLGGTVCNSQPACSDLSAWLEPPDIPYAWQQLAMFAMREGLAPTNKSIVSRVMGDDMAQIILLTYAHLALEISAIMRAATTTICVYPTDNCSAPFGMFPFCGAEEYILPYMRNLDAPFLVPMTTDSWLVDKLFAVSASVYLGQSGTHFTLFPSGGHYVSVDFGQPRYLDVIRIHLRAVLDISISFVGDSADSVCQSVDVVGESNYHWVDIVCLPQYSEYRFDLEMPNDWALHCGNDDTSLICEEWMQSTCITIPLGEVRVAGSLKLFPGCGSARCCIAEYTRFVSTSDLTIFIGTEVTRVDEIAIFAHGEEVEPLPTALALEFETRSGQSECVDEIAFHHPQLGIGGHLSPLRLTTLATQEEAVEACKEHGAVLATTLGTADIASGYANELGEACYEGRVDATACHVHARDRNEIPNPDSIDHLIESSCLTYGCFTHEVLPSLSYVSDPADGQQWDTAWTTNQKSWSSYMSALRVRVDSQARAVDFTVRRRNLTIPIPSLSPTVTDFSPYFGAPFTINVDIAAPYIDTVPSVPDPIPDQTMVEFWANSATCILTLYNYPNCGAWSKYVPSPPPISPVRQGMFNRYVLTPRNYERLIGANLFYWYDRQNSYAFDRNIDEEPFRPDLSEGCVNLDPGITCDKTGAVNFTKSFSLQGPCSVRIETDTYTYADLPPNPNVGTGIYFFSPDKDDFIRSHDFFTEEGCYPMIPSATAGVEDLITPPGTTFTESDYPNAGFSGFNHISGQIFGIYFIPQFSASKIEFEVMGQHTDTDYNTDEFLMGYEDHPYMCLPIRMKRTKMIVPGNMNIQNVTETILDQVPVVPITLEMPYEAIGCLNAIGAPCPIEHPFVECIDRGREVKKCQECQLQRTAQHSFFPSVFFEPTDFADTVDAVNQVSSVGGVETSPRIYVTWTEAPSTVHTLDVLGAAFLATYPKAYTRLHASLTPADYEIKFEVDWCMDVFKTASVDFPYMFRPRRCNVMLYPLCTRDTLKYTVATGRQCDKCGPSGRTQALDPGSTAFTQYPRAKRENDPFAHAVRDAYLDGSLEVLVTQLEDVPWDLVRQQISDHALLFAFPEARDALVRCISTRPGHISPGQEADVNRWIDMCFTQWFPYDCGLVTHPETGVERRRCAISPEYCAYERGFEGAPMDQSSVPLDLNPTTLTLPYTNPQCGVLINPASFHVYDNRGGPQPDIGAYLVSSDDPLKLRVVDSNGTWTNTGKRTGAPLYVNFTASGSVTGSVSGGEMRLWVGSLSPFFHTPSVIEYISEWTALGVFEIAHKPNSSILTTWGYDFRNVQVGSTLTFTDVLITTAETVAECLTRNLITYVELPSAVDSMAPNNQCLYDQGMCYCPPDSPMDGPGCDWPAVTIPGRGKEICNAYGDNGGYEFNSALERVKLVSDLGVFLNIDAYDCKCRNFGLEVRTVLRPASSFDYLYILRRDKEPNAAEYIEVDIPDDVSVPVTSAELIKELCNAESAALPSWNTGYEASRFVAMGVTGVLVDLIVREEDGLFVWNQRDAEFSTVVPNTTLDENDPCNGDATMCAALNWNNLAYDQTETIATDGRNISAVVSGPLSITLSTPTTDVTVEVWAGSVLVITVRADNNLCTSGVTENLHHVWTCLYTNIHVISVSSSLDPLNVREVQAFATLDTGRVPGVFT